MSENENSCNNHIWAHWNGSKKPDGYESLDTQEFLSLNLIKHLFNQYLIS